MTNFPTDFANEPTVLKGNLGTRGDEALQFLEERGFVVLAGLTREHVKAISLMANEPHIKEYCPNDCTNSRFADEDSTQKWLDGGRGVFLLAKKINQNYEPVGYGWVGTKKTDEIPGGETTFALRLGQAGLGQGLSEPFSAAVLEGAKKLYGASKIWLETWGSNEAAVHVYKKLGFKLINQKPGKRPTVKDGEVDDTRLFMASF